MDSIGYINMGHIYLHTQTHTNTNTIVVKEEIMNLGEGKRG